VVGKPAAHLTFPIKGEAVRFAFALNLIGTFLASQLFGKAMAERKEGVILGVIPRGHVHGWFGDWAAWTEPWAYVPSP